MKSADDAEPIRIDRVVLDTLAKEAAPPMTSDEELGALRARVVELETERDRMLPIYTEYLAQEKCSAEWREHERWRLAGLTEHELHCVQRHPDYEYATTENMRKSGETPMPQGDGWEPNDIVPLIINGSYRNWERSEFTETNYWRRRKLTEER